MDSCARRKSPLSVEIDDFEAALSIVSSCLTEKLPLPHESAILLSSVVRPTFPSFEQALKSCHSPDLHATKRIKVEVPLLPSEPELDVARFRLGSLEKLKINLPLESLSVEDDESLIFPSNFWIAADSIRRSTVQTRLDATKEIVQLLQDVRRPGGRDDFDIWGVSCQTAMLDLSAHRKSRKLALRPITPPLLSRPSTPEEYLPNSPSLQVPLIPEPETPSIPQHEEVKRMLAEDGTALPPGKSCTGEIGQENHLHKLLLPDALSHSHSITQLNVSSPLSTRLDRKRRSAALKVETPLTPPLTVKKRKQSNDAVAQVRGIIGAIKPGARLTAEVERGNQDEQILEDELATLAETALEQVRERLRKETLRSIPPDLKLSLPYVMPTEAVPPWSICLGAASQVQELVSAMLSEAAPIQLQSTMEVESHLDWAWLELSGSRNTEEEVTGNAWREWLIDAPEDGLLDFKSLLYETEGLGLLAKAIAEYTEDDIFNTDTIKNQHIPVKKANEQGLGVVAALEQTKQHPFTQTSKRPSDVIIKDRATRIDNASLKVRKNLKPRRKAVAGELPIPHFSAGASLADFMALRGKGNGNLQVSVPCKDANVASKTAAFPNFKSPVTDGTPELLAKKAVPLPVPRIPNFPTPQQPLTLILSTSLLKTHRHIVRELEVLSQPCHLIFRDYENGRLQLPTHLADLVPSNQEADIIISPRTAIVVSSVQETMQKYLPGQARQLKNGSNMAMSLDSPLQTKIASAAFKYEELYVLLCYMPNKAVPEFSTSSPGLALSSPSKASPFLDEHCSRAVTSFYSFCAALAPNTIIKPVIVSPPSAEVVTGWIVALANSAHRDMPWSMGQDLPLADGSREMFLRRAGLNTFSALFVLRWDSEDDNCKSGSRKDAGHWTGGVGCGRRSEEVEKREADLLAKFIHMSPIDRQRKYGLVLGSKSLRCVGRAIEMEW